MTGVGCQVTAEYVDAEAAAGSSAAAVAVAVNRERDQVSGKEVTGYGSRDRYVTARFCNIDNVVGGDVVQGERLYQRRGVNRVTLTIGVGASTVVAGSVSGGDAGVDDVAGVGDQVGTGYVDAEGVVPTYQTGGVNAVHSKGDRVACLSVAAHCTGNRYVSTRFGYIDDVVGGDREIGR